MHPQVTLPPEGALKHRKIRPIRPNNQKVMIIHLVMLGQGKRAGPDHPSRLGRMIRIRQKLLSR
jgi:hypothetical protein